MCDVYFIDDEADLRIAFEQSFELADISARFFESAEEALLAIKQDGFPPLSSSVISACRGSRVKACATPFSTKSQTFRSFLLPVTVTSPWLFRQCTMARMILSKSPFRPRG